MFEQTFKNIDDILYKDSGADSELDYIGRTSWVMFLRYLDDLEHDKGDEPALQSKTYKYIIDEEFRWPNWAMPKNRNSDNASVSLRKYLLESCNLHTVLDMPGGTFTGAGVKTVVLFFTKGEPTKKIWYYQLDPGRNMGKTNPLNDSDLKEFVALEKTKPETEKSWNIDFADIQTNNYDLSVKNPNLPEEAALRTPLAILEEMELPDEETNEILSSIKEMI